MAWIDIPESIKSYDGPYDSNVKGKVIATLQYDDESITTTSATFRFKLTCSPLDNYWDMYYVLLDPENADNRSLHKLKTDYTNPNKTDWTTKTAKAKWPYIAKETFTLKKASSDKKFIIPEFWVINDGWNNTSDTAKAFYNMYKSGGDRASYKTIHKSTELTYTESEVVVTPVGKPTITITDKYNNYFTITATQGADGTNNPATGLTDLNWGYDKQYASKYINKATYSLDIIDTSLDTRTVYVKATTKATYGASQTTETSADIRQYIAPDSASNVQITYTKSKLTIKEPWTITWDPATEKNNTSPVVGYQIRVYKNNKSIPIYIEDSDTPITSTFGEGFDKYYYNIEPASCSFTFDPALQKDPEPIKATDKIQIGIYAYTRNGQYNTNTQLFSSSEAKSIEYTVQNAGVVQVRTATGDTGWTEGQVKVYTGTESGWKEAETVKVYNGSTWDESK